jgi:hypothetical protein
MKGTPFFSGEYEKRMGPVEDRVNLWPLLYYREPALSMLWPIVERTDNYLAVRPIFSAYGLDQPRREYNVLWPLAQFDQRSGDNRIFPLFWGKDYRAAFPLYWHGGEPLGEKGGYDGLVPLWWYRQRPHDRGAGSRLHILWPVFNRRDEPGREGGRLWPFYGRYREGDRHYAFALWPLWNQHWEDDPPSSSQLLLPLFYRGRDATSSGFFSLPYSRERYDNGDNWHLLLPLALWGKDGDQRFVYSLLAGRSRSVKESSWYVLPLLSFGGHGGDAAWWWALGPLAHGKREGERHVSHVFPLYYRSAEKDESLFLSLPYSAGRDGEHAWALVPPVWYSRSSPESSVRFTPLYSWGRERADNRRWSCLFPLYYRSESDAGGSFVTPLAGVHTGAAGRRWTVYPLFSSMRREEGRGDLWVGGPLFHARWDPEGVSHHLLPLYYRNHHSGTFVSPVVSRWRTEEVSTVAAPLALSWSRSRPARSDLWVLLGLAHASWGEKAESSHLFPLFYRSPRDGVFLSPLYASLDQAPNRTVVIPPLLSAYVRDDADRDLWLLLGLAHQRWSQVPDRDEGHLFPVYHYDQEGFQTLLFGWHEGQARGWWYPLTPLLGVRTGQVRGSWLFPLYGYSRDVEADVRSGHVLWGPFRSGPDSARSSFFPVYCYERSGGRNELDVLLIGKWAEAQWSAAGRGSSTGAVMRTSTNRLFPFWSCKAQSRNGEPTERRRTVLLFLWDYLREYPRTMAGGARSDYVRSRMLYRLWHYERLDDAVSVDMIPAITYDRKADERRKVSFLWRAFRYERAGTDRAVDLLFVPVWRTRWVSGGGES